MKLTVEGGGYDEQTAQKLQALTDYMCEDDATVEEFVRRARETRNDLVKSGEHGLGLAIAGIALQSSQNALLEQQSSHDRPSQHGGTGRQPVPGSSSDTGTTASSSSAPASGVSYVGTPPPPPGTGTGSALATVVGDVFGAVVGGGLGGLIGLFFGGGVGVVPGAIIGGVVLGGVLSAGGAGAGGS